MPPRSDIILLTVNRSRSSFSIGAYHRADDGHLGQLEGDDAGVTHDTRPDLDQFQLQTDEGPFGHGVWQHNAAQEGGQIVGQRVQLQSHPVVVELPLVYSFRPRSENAPDV